MRREEVARSVGMSRQALAKLEQRNAVTGGADSGAGDRDLALCVAAVLASGPALTLDQLAHAIGVLEAPLSRVVAELVARREVMQLMASSGGDSLTYLTLGESGPDLLVDLLDQLSGRRPDTWTVYIALNRGEGPRLQAASELLSGAYRAGVIPKGVVSEMFADELALTVNADTDRTAIEIAGDLWRTLRRTAKLPAQEPRIVAFSWPRRLNRSSQ